MRHHTLTMFAAILLLSGVALKAQATFQMPPVNCADTALLEQLQPLAPDSEAKIRIGYLLAFAETPPATFQDAATVIAGVTANFITRNLEHMQAFHIKKYVLNIDRWLDELGAFCQEHPCKYDLHVALRGKRRGKPWAQRLFLDCLQKHTLDPRQIPGAIETLIEDNLAGEVANEEVKDILQKLNLRYTIRLSDDKERWAPIVAQIRTLMEQY